jgi:hypothetical protein
MTHQVSRRRLLQLATAAAAALPLSRLPLPAASAGTVPWTDATTLTLEAWSDTMVPGEKRSGDDASIAGAAAGPGAVQAGAVDLMRFPPVGLAPLLPALAAALGVEATRYAAQHQVVLEPTLPPFVALPFEHRTALALELLDGDRPDQLAWYGLAGVATLAFHTAAHLDTAQAVRAGHPGLSWIGFPAPGPDDLWRFPRFSYRRKLAEPHPDTTPSGNPA